MENIEMIQDLVAKIRKQVISEGVASEAVLESLKKMRTYSIQDENPKLTKTIRLTCEHLEENGAFLIPFLEDEEIEVSEAVSEDLEEPIEAEIEEKEAVTENQADSFEFLLSLMSDYKRASSVADLEAYKQALLNF
ncbi:MAG: hypothetical protein ACPGRE_05870 [Flavobacteriaceae bacterium]